MSHSTLSARTLSQCTLPEARVRRLLAVTRPATEGTRMIDLVVHAWSKFKILYCVDTALEIAELRSSAQAAG